MATIDGDEIVGVTIDGDEVVEITGDGDVWWTSGGSEPSTIYAEDFETTSWDQQFSQVNGWTRTDAQATQGSWSVTATDSNFLETTSGVMEPGYTLNVSYLMNSGGQPFWFEFYDSAMAMIGGIYIGETAGESYGPGNSYQEYQWYGSMSGSWGEFSATVDNNGDLTMTTQGNTWTVTDNVASDWTDISLVVRAHGATNTDVFIDDITVE